MHRLPLAATLGLVSSEVEAFYRGLPHLGNVAAAESDSDDGGNYV